ncbi:hypothetical protein Pmani_003354 [Petrolisthes manimaculis]|uniref:G-protein coupled receptors family 1 profile domain-containing protein n=1 Tax=Petrolisthes manimaculis TaxID=1843537 RepID=A0AAE1QG08_9EUCA|nr:hypothetical protein Pmani_003354 [Petrolisthes manimaculis]
MWAGNQTPCGQPLCLGMNAPEDLAPLILPHWYHFPPPSPLTHTILGIIFTLLTPIALIGNLTVIILYFRNPRLQNSSNMLVMNLATADFLMMSKAPIFVINSFTQRPYTGRLGCEVYGAVSLFSGLSAIWFLTAISLDRYRVVRLSITASTSSRVQVRPMVGVVWVVSGVVTTLPLLGWNRYVPEGVLSGCTVDYLSNGWSERSLVLLLLVLAWLAPMVAVIVSYFAILLKVKKSEAELRKLGNGCTANLTPPSPPPSSTQRKGCTRTEIRVSALMCLWTLSWTPYAVLVFVSVITNNTTVTPILATIPSVFCKASACFNPYVYGLSLPAFRKELARLLVPEWRGLNTLPPRTTRDIQQLNRTSRLGLPLATLLARPTSRAATTLTSSDCGHLTSASLLSSSTSLTPASVQRFMLPNGDIVLGMSYREAKKRNAKRKKDAFKLRFPCAPSRHITTIV